MDASLELLEAKLEDANIGSYPKDHARDLIRIVCSNFENLAPDDDHWITVFARDEDGWSSIYSGHPQLIGDDAEVKNRFFRCVIPLMILASQQEEYALIIPAQTPRNVSSPYEEFVMINCTDGANAFSAQITITRDKRTAPRITDFSFSEQLTGGLVAGPFGAMIQYLRLKNQQTLERVLSVSARMNADLSSLKPSQFVLVESFLYLYWNEIFQQIHPGAPAVGTEGHKKN